MHECPSKQAVDGLLRKKLGFGGIVISLCLDIETLSHIIGIASMTVMSFNAGDDPYSRLPILYWTAESCQKM